MNRRTSPGFSEWAFVSAAIVVSIILLLQLYQYGSVRKLYPKGFLVAGIDVGGLSQEQAVQLLTERYIEAPVIVYHKEQPFEIRPNQIEYKLNFDLLMTRAQTERDRQDYWAGFWGYLWRQPINLRPVPLEPQDATFNEAKLREVVQLFVDQLDATSQPPQAVGGSMSFQYGTTGLVTNIESSLKEIVGAFYRPKSREAHLVLEEQTAQTPTIELLYTLLTNRLQEFETQSEAIGSVFVIDLASGEEIGYNEMIPMSGMTVIRLGILLEALRVVDFENPSEKLLFDTVAADGDTKTVNRLLSLIGGSGDDGFRGADRVTYTLQKLGLQNSFIGCPYEFIGRICTQYTTPANTIDNPIIDPSPYYQTTAEDMGVLLSMVYSCSKEDGGALQLLFAGEIDSADCQLMIDALKKNRTGSLIEQGIPPDTPVAHRHGWQSDSYGDAGIVFSSKGDYVVVEFTHKKGWLAWEQSAPLMADLARGVYNYFNFENPYLVQR